MLVCFGPPGPAVSPQEERGGGNRGQPLHANSKCPIPGLHNRDLSLQGSFSGGLLKRWLIITHRHPPIGVPEKEGRSETKVRQRWRCSHRSAVVSVCTGESNNKTRAKKQKEVVQSLFAGRPAEGVPSGEGPLFRTCHQVVCSHSWTQAQPGAPPRPGGGSFSLPERKTSSRTGVPSFLLPFLSAPFYVFTRSCLNYRHGRLSTNTYGKTERSRNSS